MMIIEAVAAYLIFGVIAWLILSILMFIISNGALSSLDGSPYQKQYWKWSILGTFYIMVPIIGWIIGIVHARKDWNLHKSNVIN